MSYRKTPMLPVRAPQKAVLVCTGRAVNDALQPVGPECGRTYITGDSADLHGRARAAGWLVAVIDGRTVATCNLCRRPSPELVADCRQLAATSRDPRPGIGGLGPRTAGQAGRAGAQAGGP